MFKEDAVSKIGPTTRFIAQLVIQVVIWTAAATTVYSEVKHRLDNLEAQDGRIATAFERAEVERVALRASIRELAALVAANALTRLRLERLEQISNERTQYLNEFIELRGVIRDNRENIYRLERDIRSLQRSPTFRGATPPSGLGNEPR